MFNFICGAQEGRLGYALLSLRQPRDRSTRQGGPHELRARSQTWRRAIDRRMNQPDPATNSCWRDDKDCGRSVGRQIEDDRISLSKDRRPVGQWPNGQRSTSPTRPTRKRWQDSLWRTSLELSDLGSCLWSTSIGILSVVTERCMTCDLRFTTYIAGFTTYHLLKRMRTV